MRTLRLALALALALAGCAASTPEPIERPASYNRRELPPDEPGLLTGPDGTWTVYRNDVDRAAPPPAAEPAPQAEPEPAPPRHREVLMCDRSRNCEQPAERD